MKGIELARRYYKECGEPMLCEKFSDVLPRIAAGLCGEGSECMGYDDEISRDHDFEPGFCLFITAEDERKFGFKLERAYTALPKEFLGFTRQVLSPVGGNRHGVIVIEDFYTRHLGFARAPESDYEWLSIPSQGLLNASNGEVFADSLGVFSAVREKILAGYPEDVRLKKLAAHTALMAQAGQYNYARLMRRGEYGAAQLAAFEFVRHAISAIYLLNRRYEPYYKWAYRGLRDLPLLSDAEPTLIALTELDNTKGNDELKVELIETLSMRLIEAFQDQNITKAVCLDLEKHAYSIQDHITSSNLRQMHVMAGI